MTYQTTVEKLHTPAKVKPDLSRTKPLFILGLRRDFSGNEPHERILLSGRIPPDSHQQEQFQQLYEEILAGNRRLNLTRITEPTEFWEKHLWDSLAGTKWLPKMSQGGQKIIDIGTGAGFPGIPVAIAFPFSTVTLLDATIKKFFFTNFVNKLRLNNVITITGRAEEIGQLPSHRETYDVALVRAVGSASAVAEYALPLLKIGGVTILYRGHWSDQDTETLVRAVAKLGGTIESIELFTTTMTGCVRH